MFSEYFIDRPRLLAWFRLSWFCSAYRRLRCCRFPSIRRLRRRKSSSARRIRAPALSGGGRYGGGADRKPDQRGGEYAVYDFQPNDDGSYKLTITFNIGTDPDIAQVKVQNRIQQVMSQLPDIVQQEGLEVTTEMSNMLALLALRSPQNTYDDLYLSNYAYAYLKNPLSRVNGIGNVQIFGPQYSMRIWLNAEKISSLGLNSSDIVNIIKSQNVQASVGGIGTAPSPQGTNLVLSLTAEGLLNTVDDFNNIVVATSENGGIVRLKDVSRIELGADHLRDER